MKLGIILALQLLVSVASQELSIDKYNHTFEALCENCELDLEYDNKERCIIERLTNQSYVDINLPSINGTYPLQWATIQDYVDLSAVLITMGSDVNASDVTGKTALHFAALGGSDEITLGLLNAGADIDAKDKNQKTSLVMALNMMIQNNTPNLKYVKVTELLVDGGADLKIQGPGGWVPLHYVAIAALPNLVKRLLVKGADPNIMNEKGMTPMMLAYYWGFDWNQIIIIFFIINFHFFH